MENILDPMHPSIISEAVAIPLRLRASSSGVGVCKKTRDRLCVQRDSVKASVNRDKTAQGNEEVATG
jgi:hypothetical protein